MSLWKLRLSIFGTLAAIIGLSTLFFTIILTWTGTFSWITLGVFIVLFNLAQWLFAPYLIDAIYHTQEISRSDDQELYGMVERLSQKSGIKMPKVMVAKMPVPNAFAYGSPIAGTRVAVTTELRKTLESEEVEAVIGHELGHLKHRDVQVMMFVSLLPALFFYIGYSMLLSSGYSRRERNGGAALIGMASIFLYWILTLFTLHLSRLREYYADRHSATIVDEGPRKLSEALAKIVHSTGRMKRQRRDVGSLNSFKALFITDPDRVESDAVSMMHSGAYMGDQRLVQEVLSRKVTTLDRVAELLSSHPNIVKRLRALQELA
ncbi:MAG: zinc metalloprotease HtpX [Candidatus Bathyarchaeia archaeon]